MSKNALFTVRDHCTGATDAQVSKGRQGNARDVVRAGLRLREDPEACLAELRAVLIAGGESVASSRPITDIWAGVKARHVNAGG